ncbi:MAG: sigma-70 family RNA polymerase sigma factor [Deltaproteobacteria bacterium]|nr:sigma-70 family RNA polymerase sigma factor [Deltaproteobacteria bacterium]
MPPDPSFAASESTLIEDALRGKRAAWDALVGRHGHTVVVSLVARGLTPERARDVAQSAWLRLIEQQQAGRLSSLSLPGLAIAQAGFLAREEARRPGRKDAPLEDASQAADGAPDPERRMLGREQAARARDELAACPQSAQEVFRLAYDGQGLPHAEIARRAGLSLQRVRQILCELRQRLRTAIEEADHD